MPSKNVLHFSAGSEVFHYVWHSELATYACINSVSFVFAPAIPCVLRIAFSLSSVIFLCVESGKRHSVNEDSNLDAFLSILMVSRVTSITLNLT